MAKIVHSESAPNEAVHYTFAGVEFDLGGRGKASYETNDPAVLSNAEVHPWLTVERDPVEIIGGVHAQTLAPEDDALSAINSKANDPEAVKAAIAEAAFGQPVAIEAGLDQDKDITVGNVAETVKATTNSKDKN